LASLNLYPYFECKSRGIRHFIEGTVG